MSTKRKTAVATTRRAPAKRRRMSGKPARRSTRRRSMRGMNAKGMMDSLSDMAQVAAGMLGYGLASKFARKQWPDANPHLINAGGVVLGMVVGENMKQVRKVSVGFGAAAIGNSVMNMLPASLMQGHTNRRIDATPEQRRMIEDKLQEARSRARADMGNALNGGVDTLNGNRPDSIV